MEPRLSLTIPIFNESGNIAPLVNAFKDFHEQIGFPYELVLVNNGSLDRSQEELESCTHHLPWVRRIVLEKNRGYGGGIQVGFCHADRSATHLGWIPADLQYSIEDTYRVWQAALSEPDALHKGLRTVRQDPPRTQLISFVYSKLSQWILGVSVKDINGLPKIFPRSLWERIQFPLATSFHLDGQILLAAEKLGLPIREHPVTFFARRAGISSWSSQRVRVYQQTFFALIRMRRESAGWFT